MCYFYIYIEVSVRQKNSATMRLTSFSDYTLRVLLYLALNQGRLATIQAIADSYGISDNHLKKVVHHLAKTRVIESVRGKGGGIRLARPADSIHLGGVIRSAEGDVPVVECLGADNRCLISRNCALAGIMTGAIEHLYAYLDRYTLADLATHPAPLVKQLNIQPLVRVPVMKSA
jgi:Rrf2 family transcriptional regulator, nitric oxide-sensitive transcriptional repressor